MTHHDKCKLWYCFEMNNDSRITITNTCKSIVDGFGDDPANKSRNLISILKKKRINLLCQIRTKQRLVQEYNSAANPTAEQIKVKKFCECDINKNKNLLQILQNFRKKVGMKFQFLF